METNNKTLALIVLLVISCSWLVPEAKAHDPQYECDKKEFLDVHNKYRAMNNLPLFCWNESVEAYATAYANTRVGSCVFEHSFISYCPDMQYGENMGKSFGRDYPIKDAVQAWYDEVKDYDYESNSCAPGKVCGHYEQIVARLSNQLGCKKLKCTPEGDTFVICDYYPKGRFWGQRPY